MAPITEALRRDGIRVEAPMLAGHGGEPVDLAKVGWDDWTRAVGDAFDRLFASAADADDADADDASHDAAGVALRVGVAVGQSLGGSLALWFAASDPRCGGVVVINPVVSASDPDVTEHLEAMLDRGRVMIAVGEPDILDPDVTEDAFHEIPIRVVLAMADGVDRLRARLADINKPVLLVTSMQDSVTDPADSDELAERLPNPPTRLRLHNSGHVASLDRERDTVIDAIRSWLAAFLA